MTTKPKPTENEVTVGYVRREDQKVVFRSIDEHGFIHEKLVQGPNGDLPKGLTNKDIKNG